MKPNEGHVDRAARIILGLLLIGGGIYYQSWFGALGLIAIATGVAGFCPLYTLFGLSTLTLNKSGR